MERNEKRLTISEIVNREFDQVLGPCEFAFVFETQSSSEPMTVFPGERLLDQMNKTDTCRLYQVLRGGGEIISVKLGEFSREMVAQDHLDDVLDLIGQAFVAGMLYERKIDDDVRKPGVVRLNEGGDFDDFRASNTKGQ